VAALDRAVQRVDEPVILVGHAYGGAVLGATRHAADQTPLITRSDAVTDLITEAYQYAFG
jgi:predicted alpha/beta hydrolase family esterase